jgi:FemAB family protein
MESELITDTAQNGLPEEILHSVSASDVRTVFRKDDRSLWNSTLAALHYIPVLYSSASIDYQLAYQESHGGDWWDMSLVLYYDRRPCGVWPLAYSVTQGRAAVSSHGLSILPPLFVKGLPAKSRRTLERDCLKMLDGMCRAGGTAAPESAESFADEPSAGLSDWHARILLHGGSVAVQHELYVNLSLELDAIKARFRQVNKSQVNAGLRLWQSGVMAEPNVGLWNEFRELHLEVAGRVTRSSATWELQNQAIVEGNAFLVYLRNAEGRMVGGGFFSTTRDEGDYSVAAFDRSLFDKPLGHVVQYLAIEEMKRRGLRWYRIGLRPYPSESPTPTDKEMSIGEFKEGFATHLFPRFVLHHAVTPPPRAPGSSDRAPTSREAAQ